MKKKKNHNTTTTKLPLADDVSRPPVGLAPATAVSSGGGGEADHPDFFVTSSTRPRFKFSLESKRKLPTFSSYSFSVQIKTF